MLELLRDWWRYAQARHKMLKGGWLFPGQNPVNPVSYRQLSRACQNAVILVGFDKIGSIFRQHGSIWREAQRDHINLWQLKVMSAIERCRSAELGGHLWCCTPGDRQ